jgi:hypothetical protein
VPNVTHIKPKVTWRADPGRLIDPRRKFSSNNTRDSASIGRYKWMRCKCDGMNRYNDVMILKSMNAGCNK